MKERHASRRLRQRARELRRRETPAERVLWARLRNRQLHGLKFRRQHPIGRLIADFCCVSARVIVEVDGPVHDMQRTRDAERSRWLEQRGYAVLRFPNEQVERQLDQVLAAIADTCDARSSTEED